MGGHSPPRGRQSAGSGTVGSGPWRRKSVRSPRPLQSSPPSCSRHLGRRQRDTPPDGHQWGEGGREGEREGGREGGREEGREGRGQMLMVHTFKYMYFRSLYSYLIGLPSF